MLIPPQHHNWITSGAAGCLPSVFGGMGFKGWVYVHSATLLAADSPLMLG